MLLPKWWKRGEIADLLGKSQCDNTYSWQMVIPLSNTSKKAAKLMIFKGASLEYLRTSEQVHRLKVGQYREQLGSVYVMALHDNRTVCLKMSESTFKSALREGERLESVVRYYAGAFVIKQFIAKLLGDGQRYVFVLQKGQKLAEQASDDDDNWRVLAKTPVIRYWLTPDYTNQQMVKFYLTEVSAFSLTEMYTCKRKDPQSVMDGHIEKLMYDTLVNQTKEVEDPPHPLSNKLKCWVKRRLPFVNPRGQMVW